MRIYIASGLENIAFVSKMIAHAQNCGHVMAYDWTQHGDVRGQGEDTLSYVALNEIRSIRDADMVLILLPGGAGTHTELGAALASRSNKRIVLWSETGKEFMDNRDTCVFYHHMAVERLCCPYEGLLKFITELK